MATQPGAKIAASGVTTDRISGSWGEGPFGDETLLVHGGVEPDPQTGAILTPIFQSTTYVQQSVEDYLSKGYSYSRTRNPTVDAFERKVSEIEGAYGTVAFATGMAATVTLLTALLKSGDHCVVSDCSYGGTNRVCRVLFQERYGVEFSFVDFRDTQAVEAAITPKTKLIFSESPINPLITLADVRAISSLAKSKGIVHCCDSTFATPIVMKGLALGCDIVLQSTTKYYDGHNMTVGGALACATKELYDEMVFWRNVLGNIMSPMVAFYGLQTSKTMALRVEKQCKTAMAIALMLEAHPKVDKVVYPGLESYPQKALADRQHSNGLHGGMLWFEVKGGTDAGRKLMNTVQRPWSLCENLGAAESIITCPAVMTHANMLKADREKVGITDGLVRVSCGIEDTNDLLRALRQALDDL